MVFYILHIIQQIIDKILFINMQLTLWKIESTFSNFCNLLGDMLQPPLDILFFSAGHLPSTVVSWSHSVLTDQYLHNY